MKVFISQIMNGKTNEEILSERQLIMKTVETMYPNQDISFIDSFVDEYQNDTIANKSLWYLGRSVEKLSEANLAVFVNKCYMHTRGCKIERDCCKLYNIPIVDIKLAEVSK